MRCRDPLPGWCLLLLATLACGAPGAAAGDPTDRYLYEDTRRLVEYVESAAARVETSGESSFAEFAREGSTWATSPTYLFVYDVEGTCVFHGKTPDLVGRNLMDLKDAHGKPVIEQIVEVARRPERVASGWVFYLWQEQTELLPTWKASYIRRAVAPDGRVYAVGSGSSQLKVEKAFMQDTVDRAVEELRAHSPDEVFADMRGPASRFHYLGSFVFVLDSTGRTLVDPSFPTLSGRDMSGLRDAVGRPVVREALDRLRSSEVAWVQYLWHRPGERMPSRKLMYVRRVDVDGDVVLVGSDIFLPTPVWMRL